MAFVLDSSVALSWLLPDEENAAADALADRLSEERAVVPEIWRLEMANALLMARRRGRLTDREVDKLLSVAITLPLETDSADGNDTLPLTVDLARRYGITAYDAAYLEIAGRRSLSLATLDARLHDAASKLGIGLLL